MVYFGGVEGGATNTTAVILNENGEALGWGQGTSCNPWQVGTEEAVDCIVKAVEEAKRNASLGSDASLIGLGLCLGGSQQAMIGVLEKKYPKLTNNVVIHDDTMGSLATVCESRGIVLISGTGSNCKYMSADGSTTNCGGWGHFMGDEGGAWWIAHSAIKYLFDDDDNLKISPANTDMVRKLMHDYFKVENNSQMLDHFYTGFKKTTFAGFCKVLSEFGAYEGDALCKLVFAEAGEVLADHILAVLPKVYKDSKENAVSIEVVCVGSVWKSWALLQESFISRLKDKAKGRILSIKLLRPTTSSAIGAALLASKHCGSPVRMNYANNSELLHRELM